MVNPLVGKPAPTDRPVIDRSYSYALTVVFKDIELLVGQNATIPFTLKLASVTETLTVIGEEQP